MSALAATLRRPLGAISISPQLRRRLLVAAAAAVVLGSLYLFWLRDSSLVSVERVSVSVSGLEPRDAARVRAALTAAAGSMTTLHVDHDRLREAVAAYPVVRDLRVHSDLPHGLRIEVVQHDPAAIAVAGGSRVAVAGDGTVLRGVAAEGGLPEVEVRGSLPEAKLADPRALRLARVAGAAPLELRRRLTDVQEGGERGLTVRVRRGPLLIFGNATRVRAKWTAAARVLADPSSRGATYIDLRLPDRPAAGGVAAPTLDPLGTPGGTGQPEPSEPGAPAVPQAPAPAPAEPQAAAPSEPAPVAPQPAPTAPEGAAGGVTPNTQP